MGDQKIVFKCKKKDCIWRSNTFLYACDYSTFHDHTRVYGLPRDKWDPQYCDKYESGERKRRTIAFQTHPSINHDEAMRLYKSGLNDTEIAREMGCSLYRVQNWRQTNKLKSNTLNGNRYTIDASKAMDLYYKGWSDVAIGRELGCNSETFRRWRIARGLKANRRGNPSGLDWELGRALYDEGKTDTEIGAILHCRPDSVRKWRKKNDLQANISPNRRPNIGDRTKEKIRRLHSRGLQDMEIAVIADVSAETVYKFRRKEELASNTLGGHRRVALQVPEHIENGIMYDEETNCWWVFKRNKIVGMGRNEVEATKCYEEPK